MASKKLQGSGDVPDHGAAAYWRAHLRLILLLLAIWFAVGLGCGVLWKEFLDYARIAGTGFPIGFWFAQQGSIYVFVVLIWIYVWRMDRLDRRFGVREEDDGEQG
jgi:putative solute:sodium symporter small subunit